MKNLKMLIGYTLLITLSFTLSISNAQQLEPGEVIVFSENTDLEELSDAWQWSQGASESSSYTIVSEQSVSILGGQQTNYWQDQYTAPSLGHRVSGDFDVSISISIPETAFAEGDFFVQSTGIGVRSVGENLPFVRISRELAFGSQVVNIISDEFTVLASDDYAQSSINMRIQRVGNDFTMAYQEPDADNWTILLASYERNMTDEVEIFLFTYSNDVFRFLSEFSDFTLSEPQMIDEITTEQQVADETIEDEPTEESAEPIEIVSCEVTPRARINVRSGPSINQVVLQGLDEGVSVSAIAQVEDRSGRTWYNLAEGGWVREDTVIVEDACTDLPVAE